MSGPPRRPAGPPPPRATIDAADLGGIKRPPGPPPGVAPLASIKPPPGAPPPENLDISTQRPAIESTIKRPGNSPKRPLDAPPDLAPPKRVAPPAAAYKEGGISMFEGPDKQPEPQILEPRARFPPPRRPPPGMVPQGLSADPSLPLARTGRPPPPRQPPPGIPVGQPLPPISKPVKEGPAPPPVRPPPLSPEGGRAPPKEDPDEALRNRKVVLPPTTEPPVKREKKAKEVPILKRRERDMPEFESSDDEDEAPSFVKQPLPFGVIKQEMVAPPKEVLKTESKDFAQSAKAKPDSEKQVPSSTGAAISNKSVLLAASSADEFQETGSIASKSSLARGKDAPPLVAPSENIEANEFVPSAPPIGLAGEKHYDDSALGRFLSRGRLLIKCIEGIDIRRKDDPDRAPRNDPFLRFRLGVAERLPWKSTEVRRKQDTRPNFGNEIVFFDVIDPVQFIFQEDVQLCIELWNKSTTRNEVVGTVSMSVVRFLKQPFVSYTEKVPLYYAGATRSNMKLVLEIVFEEARSGMAQITLFEAHGLRNIDPLGRQDPYVQFSLGKYYKKRTKSVKDGGSDPFFDEEEVLLWLDQENWINDLQVDILDEDTKEEKVIASTHFSLLPYMKVSPGAAREDTYDLFYYELIDPKDDSEKRTIPSGDIVMRIRFLPAGRLTVSVDRAKGLIPPETLAGVSQSRLDPYVQLTIDGAAVQIVKRSPADKDGGPDPVWQHEIAFDVVDQFMMGVEVINQSFVGGDVVIGTAEISLLAAFRNGQAEFWTTLKQKKSNGGVKEVGDIFLKFSFTGPTGIAFPQLREDVDQFDDTLRKQPGRQGASVDPDEMARTKPPINTIPDQESTQSADQAAAIKALTDGQERGPPEFTEEEIISAFRFIDLDRNNFVGAAEIRHILICMGEMITDEEIDMMIAMVDVDGDGQVSFKEFRALVLHPNPALIDMHKEILKEKDADVMKDKQAMAGKSQGIDLTSFQRQKEMLRREEKKRMILNFIADNDIDFEYIRNIYTDFLELPKERRPSGRVKFPDFCAIMKVEPITEYKNLHSYYDDEETGDMDVREFLLSMMNYVAVDRDERIKLSFEMFDEAKTGFISQREVEEILRGNHILTLNSVRRKAETVMKQAHSDRVGTINLREFLVVSKKFPNILFPTAGVTNIPKGVRTSATASIRAI
eukprot:gene162-170_t